VATGIASMEVPVSQKKCRMKHPQNSATARQRTAHLLVGIVNQSPHPFVPTWRTTMDISSASTGVSIVCTMLSFAYIDYRLTIIPVISLAGK